MMYIAIHGDVGTGKTALMTALALGSDKPVLANYFIDCPWCQIFRPSMLTRLKEPTLVLIDEAYTWLESRISASHLNLYLSYMLFQSRKLGMDIVTTVQLASTIDKRYRELADVWIEANKEEEQFRYRWVMNSPPRYPRGEFTMSLEVAEKEIFPRYNTYEIVGDLTDLIDSIEPSAIMPDVYRTADMLLEHYPGRRWTRAAIQDYCDEKGYSKIFGEKLYNRLQRLQ